MKRPFLVKVAVIVSALVLVSGFIGYQVGAFKQNAGSDRPAAAQAPQSTNSRPERLPSVRFDADAEPAFMGSSKYIILKTPSALKDSQ